jgi:DnaK suppressor protein
VRDTPYFPDHVRRQGTITAAGAYQETTMTTRPHPYPPRPRQAPAIDLTAHLDELHDALTQQRHFRIEHLRDLATTAGPGAEYDQARQEVSACLTAAATAALTDIEAAIHRMATGSYGRCQHCRSAIPLERLEILPMVRLCMRCQRAEETSTAR